jgi:predicted MFS family arabinose efflux permease
MLGTPLFTQPASATPAMSIVVLFFGLVGLWMGVSIAFSDTPVVCEGRAAALCQIGFAVGSVFLGPERAHLGYAAAAIAAGLVLIVLAVAVWPRTRRAKPA